MARPPMKPLERDMLKRVVSRGFHDSGWIYFDKSLEIEKDIWWGLSRFLRRRDLTGR